MSVLTPAERHAAEAILDRPYADPDDDAAIVARAALRLECDREGSCHCDECCAHIQGSVTDG